MLSLSRNDLIIQELDSQWYRIRDEQQTKYSFIDRFEIISLVMS